MPKLRAMIEKVCVYAWIILLSGLLAWNIASVIKAKERITSLEGVIEYYRSNNGQVVDSLGRIVDFIHADNNVQSANTDRLKKDLAYMKKAFAQEVANRNNIPAVPVIPEMDSLVRDIKKRLK